MKGSKKFFTPLLLLLLACAAHAESPQETYQRVNAVAIQAFPKGTQGYELFWVASEASSESVNSLTSLIGAAKRQKARWVVTSDDAAAIKSSLLSAFEASTASRRIRTEIVVVSPLSRDQELVDAAKRVGASLEFFVLPPPPADSGP